MLKNNFERGKNTIIAYWILFAVIIISAINTYFEYDMYLRSKTTTIGISEINANDVRQQIIGAALATCRIVVIILFMMWLRRAYYNIRSLGVNTRYTDGWAVGAWFVPIMNLFAPYQIVREVWDNTQLKAQEKTVNPRYRSAAIVGLWWFLWIVTNSIGEYYLWFAFSPRTVDGDISIDKADILISGVELINILLIISIIKRIRIFETEMEQAMLIDNLASDQPVV